MNGPVHRVLRGVQLRGLVVACATAALTIGATTAHAQWIEDPAVDSLVHRGIRATYNIEFNEADRLFHQVIQARSDHPAGYFFEAMVDWWRILLDFDDESRDEAFIRKLNQVIAMCDKRLDQNDGDLTALFFKGGAIGFRGRLRAMRKDWVHAAGDGKAALPIVQDAAQAAPHNADISLGTGIYNYYAAILPEKYDLLKPLMLFLPPGDRGKGLRQLTFAADHARYANWEAMWFLVQAYSSYENRPSSALPYAARLVKEFPSNPVFQRALGKLYVKMADWPNVARTFSSILDRCRRSEAGYTRSAEREAEYYLGFEAMIRRDFTDAQGHLVRCDELSRSIDKDGPSGFMVMANLRMGMLHDAFGQRSIAIRQYDKVLAMKDYNGSRHVAEQYKKVPYSF